MKNEQFQSEMMNIIKKEVAKFLKSEKTIVELAESFEINNVEQRIEAWIRKQVVGNVRSAIEGFSEKTIEEVLSKPLCTYIEEHVSTVSDIIMKKLIVYFESEEGKQCISELIDRFFADKGTLGSMITMFFGNSGLLTKVYPEVMKFLHQDHTKSMLEQLLRTEWTSLKKRSFKEVEPFLNSEKVLEWLSEQLLCQIKRTNLLHTPIRILSASYQTMLLEQWLPKAFHWLCDYVVRHIELFIEKLQLDEVVRRQVESFPVERLETVILVIARRELKMITYFGALIGGAIGAVQGFILLIA